MNAAVQEINTRYSEATGMVKCQWLSESVWCKSDFVSSFAGLNHTINQAAFVCLFVCLSVCLFPISSEVL